MIAKSLGLSPKMQQFDPRHDPGDVKVLAEKKSEYVCDLWSNDHESSIWWGSLAENQGQYIGSKD